MMDDTYTLAFDGLSITCLICNMTSYHPQDVAFRYCGNCKLFHLNPLPRQIAQLRARRRGELPDDPDQAFDTSGRDYDR